MLSETWAKSWILPWVKSIEMSGRFLYFSKLEARREGKVFVTKVAKEPPMGFLRKARNGLAQAVHSNQKRVKQLQMQTVNNLG